MEIIIFPLFAFIYLIRTLELIREDLRLSSKGDTNESDSLLKVLLILLLLCASAIQFFMLCLFYYYMHCF